MGARNRERTGLSYRPARLFRLAASIPWNQFLGSLNVKKCSVHCAVCPRNLRSCSLHSPYFRPCLHGAWKTCEFQTPLFWLSFYVLYPTLLYMQLLKCHCSGGCYMNEPRARICKRFKSPAIKFQRIDSKEPIPKNRFRQHMNYVACWRAGTSNRVVVPARQAGHRFLGSLKGLKIRTLDCFRISSAARRWQYFAKFHPFQPLNHDKRTFSMVLWWGLEPSLTVIRFVTKPDTVFLNTSTQGTYSNYCMLCVHQI